MKEEVASNQNIKTFGTFGGVFTPTLLTILGVIMYLRLGWVVGNAGLLGAWLIIIISFLVTLTTALSMSSITTNIRIGAGGAYAIISKSLGLEIGGSLGIPRYVSQGLAVTLYIFGFREGWLSIFPEHSPFLIDIVTFVLLYAIAYKSADLAIKTQYFIMAIIFGSILSIVLAAYYGSMQYTTVEALKWGTFQASSDGGFTGSKFWIVFAVFFPAATGIMAGANMSGELKDPRHSIPTGTLWAIGLSFIIYMALAYWVARSASTEELVTNYNVMIEKSIFPPLVIAGVLGATFSSALASMVGSSRILYAMGADGVLPKSNWLGKLDSSGEPRNAMFITGILVFLSMLLRDLNTIAPLVTLFFLITYAMLNVVVIIEQSLGLFSFRPLFAVPRWVPWIGLVMSVLAMFIINPALSLISVAVVTAFYFILTQRKLVTPFEDVRSGIFISFAEWAAKHTLQITYGHERAWKPNLLIPVHDPKAVKGIFSFITNVTFPKGSIKLLGVGTKDRDQALGVSLNEISKSIQNRGVFSSWAVIKTDNFAKGVNYANQAYQGSFFKPNIVFLNLLDKESYEEDYHRIILESTRLQLGVLVYSHHPKSGLGQRQHINVWIGNDTDWTIAWDAGNVDLALLIAYKLKRNWNAKIRLVTVVDNEDDAQRAKNFMTELVDIARLRDTELIVEIGHLEQYLKEAPEADLNIFELSDNPNFDNMARRTEEMKSTCLFIQDSGLENILA